MKKVRTFLLLIIMLSAITLTACGGGSGSGGGGDGGGGGATPPVSSPPQVHISYYDSTNGALKYATNASGAWVAATVDNAGNVGWYTSIKVR